MIKSSKYLEFNEGCGSKYFSYYSRISLRVPDMNLQLCPSPLAPKRRSSKYYL
jgi:hypothetical protein